MVLMLEEAGPTELKSIVEALSYFINFGIYFFIV